MNFPAVFSGATALHDACDVDEPGIVAALVHAKASLTVQTDREGWTPLHHACASGSVDSVKVVLCWMGCQLVVETGSVQCVFFCWKLLEFMFGKCCLLHFLLGLDHRQGRPQRSELLGRPAA